MPREHSEALTTARSVLGVTGSARTESTLIQSPTWVHRTPVATELFGRKDRDMRVVKGSGGLSSNLGMGALHGLVHVDTAI